MKRIFIIIAASLIGANMFAQMSVSLINSGNWSNPSNWQGNMVPGANCNVIIPTGLSVSVTANVSCKNLNLNNGATLSCDSGIVLSVNGNWNNSGLFLNGKGKIAFTGNANQSLGGNNSSKFYDLEINNANLVSLSANVSILHLVSINSGTLVTSGYVFSLLSDSLMTGAIGPIANGADIIGDITVERYLSSSATGWRFLGAPVKTTLNDWSDDFITSGFPGSSYPNFYWCSIYTYDETVPGTSDNGYMMPNSGNDSISEGVGYWAWIGPTPLTIKMSGKPNKFDHTYNVSLTPSAGKGEDGWNMISNPYPSAIDWDSEGWTKVGIADAVYIWDPVLEQYASYVNGIGVNGGSNVIPSSQAFWVEATQQNPVLISSEQVKLDQNPVFQRTMNQLTGKKVLRFSLSGNNFSDEAVICIQPGASHSVMPAEDARKLYSDNPAAPSICSISDSSALGINTLPDNDDSYSIPLTVKVGASGVYSLTKSANVQLPENWCAYLEDKVTGDKKDLNTLNTYTFYIADTTSAPRFHIYITKPLQKKSESPDCSYGSNGKAILKYQSNGNWQSTWKDASSNVIAVHQNAMGTDTLKNLAPGTYFATVLDNNSACQAVSATVVVNPALSVSATASIHHNACAYNHQADINATANGGFSPYSYQWSTGDTISTVQNLASGLYTLVITDARNCKDTSYHLVKTISTLNTKFSVQNDTTGIFVNDLVVFSNQSTGEASNTWNFGNGTSGDLNPVRTFSSAGIYTVVLSNTDGVCFGNYQQILKIKAMPGDNISESGSVNIFQSEENAVVQFNLKEEKEGTISVYSMDGKLIDERRTNAYRNNETMQLGQSHGVYIIRVQAGDEIYQEKMIR